MFRKRFTSDVILYTQNRIKSCRVSRKKSVMNVAKKTEYLRGRSLGIYLMKDSALDEESEMMQTD